MININELRRNNIVWENYGGFYRVFGIKDSGKVTISKTESTIKVDFKDFDLFPVELSEEILLKCPQFEFYERLKHYRFVLDDVWYQIKVYKDGLYFSFTNLNYDEKNHMPPKKLKHLHRFQNLFAELTDVELEINL